MSTISDGISTSKNEFVHSGGDNHVPQRHEVMSIQRGERHFDTPGFIEVSKEPNVMKLRHRDAPVKSVLLPITIRYLPDTDNSDDDDDQPMPEEPMEIQYEDTIPMEVTRVTGKKVECNFSENGRPCHLC